MQFLNLRVNGLLKKNTFARCFLCRHFQKAGTPYTMKDVEAWAKRPFRGEDVFVVGSAVHRLRGWSEGAIGSADNALLEGWGIKRDTINHILNGSPLNRSPGLSRALLRNTGKGFARP